MNPLYLALAGLGGFLVYENLEGDTAMAPSLPVSPGQTTSKYVPLNGLTVKPLVATLTPKLSSSVTSFGGGVPKNPSFVNIFRNGSVAKNTKATAGSTQQLIDQQKAKLKGEYDKLSASAKAEGAKALNSLIKPSPGLTGKEDWAGASKKIGAAIGTAAGTALGTFIGNPELGVLGAMAGAYLGTKLGPEIAKAWQDIESWSHNVATNVEKKVSDTANNVAHDIGHFLHLV